ncbi:MAG: hypothetical protein PVG72_09015 [Gammaproteobacteria bacterium]
MAAIFDSETLVLNAAGGGFPASYTRAETAGARVTVIILHGCGTHPNREQVAGPPRKQLRLPGEYVEAPARIDAAPANLHERARIASYRSPTVAAYSRARQQGDAGIGADTGMGCKRLPATAAARSVTAR